MRAELTHGRVDAAPPGRQAGSHSPGTSGRRSGFDLYPMGNQPVNVSVSGFMAPGGRAWEGDQGPVTPFVLFKMFISQVGNAVFYVYF